MLSANPKFACTGERIIQKTPLIWAGGNSTRLFTNPLTASPLAFTASLPKQKHSRTKSRQLRRLYFGASILVTTVKSFAAKYECTCSLILFATTISKISVKETDLNFVRVKKVLTSAREISVANVISVAKNFWIGL